MKVTLPNGQKLNFPDGMSEDEMRAAIDENFPEYAPKKQESPKEKQNPLMMMAEKIGRYAGLDPAIGIAKAGESIINAPHYLEEFARGGPAKIFGKFDSGVGQAMGIPDEQRNTADKVIQGAPEFLATLLAPETKLGQAGSLIERIPQAGKYLKTALGNAITQGGISAATSGDREAVGETAAITAPFSALAKGATEGSPLTRLLTKGLLSAGAGGLGYMGAKAVGTGNLGALGAGGLVGLASLKGHGPLLNPTKDVLEGVEGTAFQDSLDAAKRLGLKYLTPAEASGTPYTGAVQGSLGKTAEGSKKYLQEGTERLKSEKESIQNLFKTIYNPEELSAKKTSLYDQVNPTLVTKKKLNPLYKNEVFKAALKSVETEAESIEKLKGVPKNSIEYMQEVKEALDKRQFQVLKDTGKKSSEVNKVRRKLIDTLDEASPKFIDANGKEQSLYKEARALGEREITRNKVEDFFDKRKMMGSNFAKFLASEKNFNKLQTSLRNVPEAQQQIKDMKLIFEKLINVPTSKMASAQASTSMSKARSSTQDWKTMLKEVFSGGKYDKNAIELMTNPNWASELEKMKGVSDKEKLAGKLIDLLGKAGAKEITQ